MKRLKVGMSVLVEARDWVSDVSWQSPAEAVTPAPLGWIRGVVISQDETTLCVAHAGFDESPEISTTKVPLGCIEAVWESVERREPLWRARCRAKRPLSDPT